MTNTYSVQDQSTVVTDAKSADYKPIIRIFKETTALAHDILEPLAIANLSNDATCRFISFSRRSKRANMWSQAWTNSIMIIIIELKHTNCASLLWFSFCTACVPRKLANTSAVECSRFIRTGQRVILQIHWRCGVWQNVGQWHMPWLD